MNLANHLNRSIIKEERVDESLFLGGFLATMLLSTAFQGVASSNGKGGGGFMQSLSPGLNMLMGGIGSVFSGFGLLTSRVTGNSTPNMTPEDLDELLKKDPDDMTGIEKKQLKQIAKSSKYKDHLTNNQLKKLNGVIAALETTEGGEDENKGEDVATEYTPEMMAGLMTMAKKANDEEKDKTKKAKNDAMLDLLASCSYDKDGNEIEMEKRLEKMKGIVGEDTWESFKAEMEKTFNEHKDSDEFKKALEKAKDNLTKEDAESFVNSAKERAKATLEKVEKEQQEQAEIDKDIADLHAEIDKEKQKSVFKPEENAKLKELVDKLKKRQEDREKLANNSIAGQVSPTAVNNSIEIQNKKEAFEAAKRKYDAQTEKVNNLQTELDAITDKESQDYKDKKQALETETNKQKELKKKMDDAEKAKKDAETKAGVGGAKSTEPKMTDTSVTLLDDDGEPTGEKIIKKEDGTYKKVDKNGNESDATEDAWNEARTEFDKEQHGEDEENSEEDNNAGNDLDDNHTETDEEKNSEEGKSADRDASGKRMNPAQKWHKRKKKNGNGTTKSYYDKDGNSISVKEFKKKMISYKNYVKNHKKNNETTQQGGSSGNGTSENSIYTELKNYLLEHLDF